MKEMRLLLAGLFAITAQNAAAQARIPGRIIGVFDDRTGLPLAEVIVEDMFTGWSAQTTATGTVSLFYVDTGGTMLRVKKVGYVPQTMPVRNSPTDTTPITVILKPSAQVLPTATTTAKTHRGPADTVRKLERMGFYERRLSQGAPERAFVTTKELSKARLVSDVVRFSGRQFCPSNIYIDGVKVELPNLNLRGNARGPRTTKLLKDGIDALLEPELIVGIEMYKVSDTPAQYNATAPPGQPPCGATLIWTR
jgi:hypothetical protein